MGAVCQRSHRCAGPSNSREGYLDIAPRLQVQCQVSRSAPADSQASHPYLHACVEVLPSSVPFLCGSSSSSPPPLWDVASTAARRLDDFFFSPSSLPLFHLLLFPMSFPPFSVHICSFIVFFFLSSSYPRTYIHSERRAPF